MVLVSALTLTHFIRDLPCQTYLIKSVIKIKHMLNTVIMIEILPMSHFQLLFLIFIPVFVMGHFYTVSTDFEFFGWAIFHINETLTHGPFLSKLM